MKLTELMNMPVTHIEAMNLPYLREMGWFNTRATGRSTDTTGAPIPWFTYPAIAFLLRHVRHDLSVLEFGSGGGTHWWAKHAGSVTAVEHDPVWLRCLQDNPAISTITTVDTSATEYLRPVRGNTGFDIVIVDGIYRNQCLELAPDLLSHSGVIIFDDAHREEHMDALSEVQQRGFRILEFFGLQPISKHLGCTAIIYRSNNVLGI